jgi:gamma-glutamyl:cysteine ligase YbdK (ATP-grasp superfamily)
VEDTLALAALAQGLVAHLCQQYDADGRLPEPHALELVDENLWRAARFGSHAELVDLPGTGVRPVAELAAECVERARDAGASAGLGIDAGLDRVLEIVRDGSSSVRQREVASVGGLRAAYELVVDETMQSVHTPYAGRS